MADKKEVDSTQAKKEATPPQTKPLSPDKLSKHRKTGDKELSDDVLKDVAGGRDSDDHIKF
jgi:hypothetical protein